MVYASRLHFAFRVPALCRRWGTRAPRTRWGYQAKLESINTAVCWPGAARTGRAVRPMSSIIVRLAASATGLAVCKAVGARNA